MALRRLLQRGELLPRRGELLLARGGGAQVVLPRRGLGRERLSRLLARGGEGLLVVRAQVVERRLARRVELGAQGPERRVVGRRLGSLSPGGLERGRGVALRGLQRVGALPAGGLKGLVALRLRRLELGAQRVEGRAVGGEGIRGLALGLLQRRGALLTRILHVFLRRREPRPQRVDRRAVGLRLGQGRRALPADRLERRVPLGQRPGVLRPTLIDELLGRLGARDQRGLVALAPRLRHHTIGLLLSQCVELAPELRDLGLGRPQLPFIALLLAEEPVAAAVAQKPPQKTLQ